MNPLKLSLTKKKTRKYSNSHLKNIHLQLPNISSNYNPPKLYKSPRIHARKLQNKYKNDFGLQSSVILLKQLSVPQNESINKKKVLILKPTPKHSSRYDSQDMTKQILLNNNVGIPDFKEIERQLKEKILDMNEKIEIEDFKEESYTYESINKPIILHSNSLFLKKPKYKPGIEMNFNNILKRLNTQIFRRQKTFIIDEKTKKPIKHKKRVKSMNNITKFKLTLFEKSDKSLGIKNNFRQLLKKNILFDSLDEDEFEEEKKNDYMEISISPNNIFIFVFDFLLFISTFYLLVFTPYFLSKTNCFCNFENNKVVVINVIIEILFILDVIISFFRGYYDFEFNLIKQNKKIAINYLSGHFTWDLIEALPIYYYSLLKCNLDENLNSFCQEYSMSTNLIIIKLLLSLKLLKIMKIAKKEKNRNSKFLYELICRNNFKIEKIIDLSALIFYCFLFLHYLVCLYLFLGKQSYPNWLSNIKIQNNNFASKYIISFYFIITTMSTVGYGDITCQSSIERIFQIILLTIGIVAYSFIVSKMGNYFKNESHSLTKLNKDTNILEEIRIAYPTMPFELYKKIYHHLLHRFKKEKKLGLNILMNSLPFSIKKQILFTVYQEQIKNFIFFKNCDNSNFIFKILSNFILFSCKKDEYIVYEGERVSNIIFVKEGCLSLELSINIDDPHTSLENYLTKNFVGVEPKKNNMADTLFSQIGASYLSKKSEINFSGLKTRIGDVLNFGKNGLINKNEHNTFTDEEESKVYREAGKIDIGDEVNFENHGTNYQHIKVVDIRKNEYFGYYNIHKDKNAPLSLKVKSKFAELFLINKQTVNDIKKEYPNICKKIYNISLYNLVTIKKLTFRILKSYIETYGIFEYANEKRKEAINDLEAKAKEASLLNSNASSVVSTNNNIEACINKNIKSSNVSDFKLDKNKDKNSKIINDSVKATKVSKQSALSLFKNTDIKNQNEQSNTILYINKYKIDDCSENIIKNDIESKTLRQKTIKNSKFFDEYDGDDEYEENKNDSNDNIFSETNSREKTKDLIKNYYSEDEASKISINEKNMICTLNIMNNSMKNKIKKVFWHSQKKLKNKKIFCLLKQFLIENKEKIFQLCSSEETTKQKKIIDPNLSISSNTNVVNILSQIEKLNYSWSDSSTTENQNNDKCIFDITKMDSFEIKSIYPNINTIIKKNKNHKNDSFFEEYKKIFKKLEKKTIKSNKTINHFSDFLGIMKKYSNKKMSLSPIHLSKSKNKIKIKNFMNSEEQKIKDSIRKYSSKSRNSKISSHDSSLFDINVEHNLNSTAKNIITKKKMEKFSYSGFNDVNNSSFLNENNMSVKSYKNHIKNIEESSQTSKYNRHSPPSSSKSKKRISIINKSEINKDKSKTKSMKSKFSNKNMISNLNNREFTSKLIKKNKQNINEKSLDRSDMNNDVSKTIFSGKVLITNNNYDYLDKNGGESENSGRNCIIY